MIRILELAGRLRHGAAPGRHRLTWAATLAPRQPFGLGAMMGVLVAWAMACPAMAADDAGGAAQPAGQVSEIGTTDAVGTLKRMHDYLLDRTDLEFRTTFSRTDEALSLNKRGSIHFRIRKPNLFRVEASDGSHSTVYISDGETVTIIGSKDPKWTKLPARGSVLGTMYASAGVAGEQAWILDFFWAVDYLSDADAVAKVVDNGVSDTIAGQKCRRISIDRMQESWDVWIAQNPPLPCKLVIRKRDDPSGPVQTNEFTWTTDPAFSAQTFTISAP